MIVLRTEVKKKCHKGLIGLIFSIVLSDYKLSGIMFMIIPLGIADTLEDTL